MLQHAKIKIQKLMGMYQCIKSMTSFTKRDKFNDKHQKHIYFIHKNHILKCQVSNSIGNFVPLLPNFEKLQSINETSQFEKSTLFFMAPTFYYTILLYTRDYPVFIHQLCYRFTLYVLIRFLTYHNVSLSLKYVLTRFSGFLQV